MEGKKASYEWSLLMAVSQSNAAVPPARKLAIRYRPSKNIVVDVQGSLPETRHPSVRSKSSSLCLTGQVMDNRKQHIT